MKSRVMTVLSFFLQYCPIVLSVVIIGWALVSRLGSMSNGAEVVTVETLHKEVVSKDHALTFGMVLLGLALLPRLYLRRKYPAKTQDQ